MKTPPLPGMLLGFMDPENSGAIDAVHLHTGLPESRYVDPVHFHVAAAFEEEAGVRVACLASSPNQVEISKYNIAAPGA